MSSLREPTPPPPQHTLRASLWSIRMLAFLPKGLECHCEYHLSDRGCSVSCSSSSDKMANIDAPRFEGIVRPYTEADVAKLQGSMKVEYTLANEGAKKLWVRAPPPLPLFSPAVAVLPPVRTHPRSALVSWSCAPTWPPPRWATC